MRHIADAILLLNSFGETRYQLNVRHTTSGHWVAFIAPVGATGNTTAVLHPSLGHQLHATNDDAATALVELARLCHDLAPDSGLELPPEQVEFIDLAEKLGYDPTWYGRTGRRGRKILTVRGVAPGASKNVLRVVDENGKGYRTNVEFVRSMFEE